MKKRILAVILCVLMVVGMFPVSAGALDSVEYVSRSWDSTVGVTVAETLTCTDYTVVDSSTTEFTTGWYVVNNNVTISGNVNVPGDAEVNLILCDGKTLTVNGYFGANSEGSQNGGKVTIYAQTGGSGSIEVTHNPSSGRARGFYVKSLTVNGGIVKASATSQNENSVGCATPAVTVNGGVVEFFAASYATLDNLPAYGVNNGTSGTLTVNGGTVKCTAVNPYYRANGVRSKTTINGGKLEAYATGNTEDSSAIYSALAVNDGTVIMAGNKLALSGQPTAGGVSLNKIAAVPANVTIKTSSNQDGTGAAVWDKAALLHGTADYKYISISFPPNAAVEYLDTDGKTKMAKAYLIDSGTTAIGVSGSTKWYAVTGSSPIEVSSAITVSGNVNLILSDGASLTVTPPDDSTNAAGLTVKSGNSLTIYGQKAGTGVLATLGRKSGSGIGGAGATNGTITINGGVINATGGANGTGIGAGTGKGGSITVNGGKITATGGKFCAGIGGGNNGSGGTITINGGDITATGGTSGAGIGGGYGSAGGTITVNGGVINATGGTNGAGIGGGINGAGGTISINGGAVTATCGGSGMGIGGGSGGGAGTLTLSEGFDILAGDSAPGNTVSVADFLNSHTAKYAKLTPADPRFDPCSGDAVISSETVPTTYTKGETKWGDYVFNGWYTSRTGGTELTSDPTAGKTYYAHWLNGSGSDAKTVLTECLTVKDDGLYIGSSKLTAEDAAQYGFVFTAAAADPAAPAKLTMTDAAIESPDYTGLLNMVDGLELACEGDSFVTAYGLKYVLNSSSEDWQNFAVDTNGYSMVITGSGILTARSRDVDGIEQTPTVAQPRYVLNGIYVKGADKMITVDMEKTGKVNAIGGDISSNIGGVSSGFSQSLKMLGGTLTATGGSVTTTGEYQAQSFGLSSIGDKNGTYGPKGTTISGGQIIASAGAVKSEGTSQVDSVAINLTYGQGCGGIAADCYPKLRINGAESLPAADKNSFKFIQAAADVPVTINCVPMITVSKVQVGDPAADIANPVFGKATSATDFFTVEAVNFTEATALKLEWKSGDAWSETAPYSTLTASLSSGKISIATQASLAAGEYPFRVTNGEAETIADPADDTKTIPNPDFVSGEGVLTIEKSPDTPPYGTPTSKTIVGRTGKDNQTGTINLDLLEWNPPTGTAWVSNIVETEDTKNIISINDSTYTFANTNEIATATVEVTVSSTNWEDFIYTLTFETKNATPVTVSGVSMAYPDSQTSFIFGDTVGYTGTPAAVITADSTGVTIPEYAYTYYESDGAGGWTELTAAPADAGSYKLVISAVSDDYVGKQEIPFTIEKKTVELIWTEDDFTYDGTDQKSMITVRFVDNDGEDVSLYFTLEVANANGGASVEFKDVTPFGYVAEVMDNTANENKLGENYQFPATLTKSYTMKPAPVTVFAIPVQAKTYNGRTDDAVLLLDSVIFDTVYGSDELTVSGIEGTYASADASDAQTVELNEPANWTLGGASKANYVLADTQPTETTGEIARFDLSGATVAVDPDGYTYDEAGVEPIPTVTFDGTNEIPASDLSLSYINNTKAASAADANAPTVTVSDKSGNLTGSIDAAFTINKGAKPADVPETCTIGATAVSALSLDDIGIDLDGAVITAVNAVSGKTGKVLDGAPAIDSGAESISWTVLDEPSSTESDQYTLTVSSDNYEDFTVTVTFTGKAIVTFDPDFTVDDKTYDGSEMSAANPTVTVGGTVLDPQPELTLTYYEIGSAAPLDGAPTKAGDYKVVIAVAEDDLQYVGSEEYTFTIEPAEITVSGITAKDKAYDGKTDAELDFTAAILDGLVGGDDLSVTAAGAFADANVGEDKTVTISDLTLTGSDAANYELAASGQQTTAIASIICGAHDWTNKDGKCAICGYECDHDGKTDGVCDICGKELNAAGNTDSELEVLPGTPAVTESGLSKVAEAEAEDGKQVRLTMTVEAKPATDAEGAAAIEALPEAQGKEIEYLNISIAKFVNGEFDCYVTDTDTNLVTLNIPFETEGKTIGVIRYHGGAAEVMQKDPAAGQEGFTVGTNLVTIYASKFSTYAIVYENAQPDPTPEPGSYTPTTYPVNGPDATENGKVTISTKRASEGEKVTLTAKPDEGYTLDSITVTDKNGKEIALTSLGNGKYSFMMPAGKVTVEASFKAIETEEPADGPESKPCPKDDTCPIAKFDDTTVDFWWHDGIHYCLENGLMKGVSDAEFDPNGTTSRAMIATILWRLEGEKYANYAMSFSDVAEGEWYTEAIRWAAAESIVKGYDDGTYQPDKAITREELAAILYRYAQMKGEGFVGASMFLMPFDDLMEISDWASESVRWCYMKHIILGRTETTFVPKATATRAEAAAMIQRFCMSLEK